MYRLFLALGLLLHLVGGRAHAEILANFENPAPGIVSGVGQVDGWTFTTDDIDKVTNVMFSIDGTDQWSIPFGSERLDVAQAHSSYTQARTSGFATKINWGLFSAGSHDIRIQVTTRSGQVLYTASREIVVVKLADLEFVTGIDMSEATSRVENGEVIVDGVRVDEKDVELRLKWDTATQAFTISSIKNRSVVEDNGRFALVQFPAQKETDEPLPLILLLHGYTMDAKTQDAYFRLSDVVDVRRFILVLANGTRENSPGAFRFWNAIPNACCNFYGSTVDDVEYLNQLIATTKENYEIDSRRVYVVGYSNGGFMAHRMACDKAAEIAAIVSFAGSTYHDEERCGAEEPVSTLQIHGTLDTVVPFAGKNTGGFNYPGASATVTRLARSAGCTLTNPDAGTTVDLVDDINGPETGITMFSEGCSHGVSIGLWTMNGASHFPSLGSQFPEHVVDWLFQQEKEF